MDLDFVGLAGCFPGGVGGGEKKKKSLISGRGLDACMEVCFPCGIMIT